MKESESPSNPWATVTLGDLSEVKSGVGFPKKYQGQSSGDYPVYKVGDVSRAVTLGQGLLNSANHYVTTEEAGELKGVIFRTGSTLFAKIGEAVKLNRRAFVMRPGLADNNVMAVVPLLNESDRYLHYFLRTVDLSDISRSTTVPSVRKGEIEDLIIPLPPLAEQKVIADKLDTLLAQVENTKARLERIPQILKRFRQSVLAAAVSGRLTEEWREDSTYNDEGYPDSWTFKHLSEVGKLARGKSKHRPRNDPRLFGEEYPFIQTGEVANATGEITSATRFYSAFGLEQSRLFPAGTLCITIAANIADTAILGIDACFPDSVVGFTPKDSEALAYFVKFLIDVNKQDLESFAPATAQKNINLKVLNELRLPFPSLEEQTEIVRRVDQLFAHADRIEHQVNDALARVNNLTQSILAKAFRGELTEQWRKDNPELISGENGAEALLERIRSERAAQKPTRRRTKIAKTEQAAK
ncbi:restriction endonuclease subunit S [Marinobacter nauticus]|uniref:Type I restriction enzyme S subunit n=1 Tax=Marinobacter nauticus TaxID=2743 RepID=A0A368V6K7_MARNT|nr:restriction endonuclease subunit S [Marinobacter nauticus]RBP75624.1 type I restriction enzyme S subunit [Marinobacter nauticus]RCW36433.1 type I restriction enzyme S subunit [Marinobacter nauticus]